VSAPDHSSLPLHDYDHLPLPALAQRIRPLRSGEITQLLAYEREHANRPAALLIFRNRLAELAAGESPTPGRQQSGPDWPEPPAGGSRVKPQTAGPPVSPPPHGTPAQPAKPKADRRGP
jgi:hypothetical protein